MGGGRVNALNFQMSEGIYVTLDWKTGGVDAAHDHGHIDRGLVRHFRPSGAGNRGRDHCDDSGGIHAGVTSDLVGLGHG